MNQEKRKHSSPIEQSYRTLIANIKDYAIFMLDKEGSIMSWDQGASKLFGYTRGEIIGKNFSVLFSAKDKKNGVPGLDMTTAVSVGKHLDERQYVKKNKTTFWSSGVLTSNRNKIGNHLGFSKLMRDVSEQTDLHAIAVHNSTHDYLTGLPNRNFFEEKFLESIPNTKKGDILAILYMDFNNFKRTNDEQGHRFGDLVLIEIGHRLSPAIRESDLVARFGGDEFVILAKGMKTKAEIVRFTKKILNSFKTPIIIDKKSIQTSVSIGVALYPTDGKKAGDLLHFADMALYQAKKSGGNCAQLYDKSSM